MIPPFTIGAASAPVPRYAEAKGERTETRPTAALVTTDGGSLSTGLDQDPVDVARAAAAGPTQSQAGNELGRKQPALASYDVEEGGSDAGGGGNDAGMDRNDGNDVGVDGNAGNDAGADGYDGNERHAGRPCCRSSQKAGNRTCRYLQASYDARKDGNDGGTYC
ncbi:MAG: hypothetical protein Q9167_008066 [Letrouitia subvulpina]